MAFPNDGKKFKKGESGNPKGRPRKSFASINDELKAKGIGKLSKSDLLDAYALIFNSSELELIELETNEDIPIAFKIILENLTDKKTRTKAMEDFRDYTFGRATENIEVNKNVMIFELPANGRESKDEQQNEK
jgi:hypothetical protein